MTNKENLKKQIIYRSTHRGSKEMDLLLGNFVKNNIDALNDIELKYLEEFLLIEDEILYANMSRSYNPYGDGRACERIVEFVAGILND